MGVKVYIISICIVFLQGPLISSGPNKLPIYAVCSNVGCIVAQSGVLLCHSYFLVLTHITSRMNMWDKKNSGSNNVFGKTVVVTEVHQ